MLRYYLMHSKMDQLYIYIHSFRLFSHISHYRVLSRVPYDLQWCYKIVVQSLSHVQIFATPWTVAHFPGKNIGVDYHFLLQRTFPTQRQNLGLRHCRRIPYQLSLQGSHAIQYVLINYLFYIQQCVYGLPRKAYQALPSM